MFEQPNDVLPHLLAVSFRIGGLAAFPMTPAVQCNHSMILHQVAEDAGCDPMAFKVSGIAVDQHDGGTLSLIHIADLNAVGIEKFIRENGSLSYHRQRQQKQRPDSVKQCQAPSSLLRNKPIRTR